MQKKILDNPDKEQGSLKVDEKKNKNKKYFFFEIFQFWDWNKFNFYII